MPPQPGMPAAPYPTQYPPPYLAHPTGPPAYHETLAGKYHCGFSNLAWFPSSALCSSGPFLLACLPVGCSPVFPQLTHFLFTFRRLSTLLCQPASVQPGLHGSPKGSSLSLPQASLAVI